jgi:DNA transposition AAA+ family ATPase
MEKQEPENTHEPLNQTVRATWNFSVDQALADMARYKPEHRDALLALMRWCIDPRHPMKKVDAAIRIGCSDNLLYQLYTGRYRKPDKTPADPSDDLIRKIGEFLKIEAERYALGETEFIETPTAKKVFTACNLARESQSPVIMWGPSHIGKTWALRQYQQANNHGKTLLAELEAASGLGGMVRTLAGAAGISDKSNTAALVERIKAGLTPNTLLIVDEVHLLKHTYRLNSFFACIEVLRRIYDYCRCGVVLSWTNIDSLKGASQGELVQLWRRGVHKIALPLMPTKGDIAAILHKNGLEFPDAKFTVSVPARREVIVETPYEILRQLARNDGLKAITERVRYARKLSGKTGGNISWAHFVDAHLRIVKEAIAEPEWN